MAGRKQNLSPMWKKWMKPVDLGEPTSFPDYVYLGCTPREKLSLPNTEKCSNHEFLLEQVKNYQSGRDLTQKLPRGPTTWKDMLKNALRDIVNWRTKRQSNYTKSQVLACVTITSRRGTWLSWRIVKSMLTDRLEMLLCGTNWWTWDSAACKQTVYRSHKIHRSLWQTLTHVWNTAQHCRLSLFQDSDAYSCVELDWVYSKTQILLETLKILHQLREESCVFSEVEHSSP